MWQTSVKGSAGLRANHAYTYVAILVRMFNANVAFAVRTPGRVQTHICAACRRARVCAGARQNRVEFGQRARGSEHIDIGAHGSLM